MKKLFLSLLFCSSLLAVEGNTFSVVGMPESEPGKNEIPSLDNPEVQNRLINSLKQKAVVQWLQNYLGSRYQSYQKSVTDEFGEKYVLDYKVARVAGQSNTLELSGHLDADALRKWVRVSDTKEKGSAAIRPIFIFSSLAGSQQSLPKDTPDKTKDLPGAQILFKEASQHFQKLNAKLNPLESRITASSPPTYESEVASLASELNTANVNTILWAHLSQCVSCPTARLDLYLYSLTPPRLASVKSEELGVGANALSQPEKSKTVLTPLLALLHEGIDEVVSEGKLFSRDLTLRIEGIDAYRSYKQIEKDLQRQDYLSQPSLKLIEPAAAEFNFVSNTPTEELAQRMQTSQWSGFKLQAVRVDSDTIVMRYLR